MRYWNFFKGAAHFNLRSLRFYRSHSSCITTLSQGERNDANHR